MHISNTIGRRLVRQRAHLQDRPGLQRDPPGPHPERRHLRGGGQEVRRRLHGAQGVADQQLGRV